MVSGGPSDPLGRETFVSFSPESRLVEAPIIISYLRITGIWMVLNATEKYLDSIVWDWVVELKCSGMVSDGT